MILTSSSPFTWCQLSSRLFPTPSSFFPSHPHRVHYLPRLFLQFLPPLSSYILVWWTYQLVAYVKLEESGVLRTLLETLILLLGEIYVGSTLWRWHPHKVVGLMFISSNKRVSVRVSIGKRVFLALLINYVYKTTCHASKYQPVQKQREITTIGYIRSTKWIKQQYDILFWIVCNDSWLTI